MRKVVLGVLLIAVMLAGCGGTETQTVRLDKKERDRAYNDGWDRGKAFGENWSAVSAAEKERIENRAFSEGEESAFQLDEELEQEFAEEEEQEERRENRESRQLEESESEALEPLEREAEELNPSFEHT